jgi:hypothetical protein
MKNMPRWVVVLLAVVLGCAVVLGVAVVKMVLYVRQTTTSLIADLSSAPTVDVSKQGDSLVIANFGKKPLGKILITLKTEEKPTKKHGSGLHREYYYRIPKVDAGQTSRVPLKNFHSKFNEMFDPHEVAAYGVALNADDGTQFSMSQGL